MEERIETSWDRVGVIGDSGSVVSSRVVRAVVRDPNKSNDEIQHPERRRHFSFGRWYREKKPVTSMLLPLLCLTMNDSILFKRVPSSSVTIKEMTKLRRSALQKPLR